MSRPLFATVAGFLLAFLALPAAVVPAPAGPRADTAFASLDPKTDVHYNEKYCQVCHTQLPPKGRGAFLKYAGDFKQLCRCHYGGGESYIHPTDFEPSPRMARNIPANFELKEGRVACSTCHDILVQCQTDASARYINSNFLRGAPYDRRIDICFKCHDPAAYERYNPHRQIDAKGKIIAERCLQCHVTVPDPQNATQEDIALVAEYEALCQRCHMQRPGANLHDAHIRFPSGKVLRRIQQMEFEYGIKMPLSDVGRITCVTCHNPHEKGALPEEKPSAQVQGEDHRHRLAGNLCMKCHDLF